MTELLMKAVYLLAAYWYVPGLLALFGGLTRLLMQGPQ